MVNFTDWENGHVQHLDIGPHYFQRCRSMEIPEGYRVKFYANQDQSGWSSRWFYQEKYRDLELHGIPESPGMILIENTDLKSHDFVRAINLGITPWYDIIWMLPIGDRVAGEDFDGDTIDAFEIPYGVSVEAFADAIGSESKLLFSGQIENGYSRYNLNDYNYADVVSGIRITADEWEPAGMSLENETIENGEVVGSTAEISINDADVEASTSKTITCSYTESKTTQWDIHAGVKVSQEFEYSVGVAKGKTGIEVSVDGGYGESGTKSKDVQISDTINLSGKVPGTYKASLYIEYGKMKADIVRKLRNRRTGAIIEERGKFASDQWTNKSRVEVHRVTA